MTPATTRRPRRDAARTHQLIVEAARQVFGEAGVEASMEQIAARAGVGVGTVYRRFPSKDSLIDELVRLVTDELVGQGEQALALDDGAGLEAFLWAIGRSLAEHRRWAGLLLARSKRGEFQAGVIRDQIARLFGDARRAGTVGPGVELGDVMMLTWSLRGLIETCGDVAPDAWRRFLDIHLVALRSPGLLSTTPAVTSVQLAELPESRQPVTAGRSADPPPAAGTAR
jgi:AcrR family transcriptional regulator